MGTSADAYFPFDAGAGANVAEASWRKMAEFWLRPGVIRGELNSLAAFGDSSGIQVKVPTGKAFVKGHYGEWTSQKTLTNFAAVGGIPGGQSRIDRLVARADFDANVVELDILTGSPAASPSPPALTQTTSRWEIPIAQVGPFTSASTTVSPGMVTDERQYAGAVNFAAGGRTGCTVHRSATQSITSGVLTAVTWTVEDFDSDGFIAVSSATITIPAGCAGLYAAITNLAAGTAVSFDVVQLATSARNYDQFGAPTGDQGGSWCPVPLAVGDTVQLKVRQSLGSPVTVQPRLELYRVGA